MDDKKQEEIRRQAKQILDSFASSLDKVKLKDKKQNKQVGGFRGQKESAKHDDEFRKRIFANAPNKEGDYILAEKKLW